MNLVGFLIAVGLAGCWRATLDKRTSEVVRYGSVAVGVGLATVSAALEDGPINALWALPFILGGSFTVAWVSMASTEKWSVRTVHAVASGGLALLALTLAL